MTAATAMIIVSTFTGMGALFLAFMLRRYHRNNSVAKRIAWLPCATGLQALNVVLSFMFDSNTVNVPIGILARSVGGWLGIGLVLWYLGFYFAGKVNHH
jgi:hypothetical protein